MTDEKTQNRMLALMVMLALWLATFGYSVSILLSGDPAADVFTGGLSRASKFLGWQGVAGVVAVAVWGVGRGFPRVSGIRRITGIPIGIALTLGMVLAGATFYSKL